MFIEHPGPKSCIFLENKENFREKNCWTRNGNLFKYLKKNIFFQEPTEKIAC